MCQKDSGTIEIGFPEEATFLKVSWGQLYMVLGKEKTSY